MVILILKKRKMIPSNQSDGLGFNFTASTHCDTICWKIRPSVYRTNYVELEFIKISQRVVLVIVHTEEST
jgi:hypothetical protein